MCIRDSLYPSQLRLVLDLATPEGCKAKAESGVQEEGAKWVGRPAGNSGLHVMMEGVGLVYCVPTQIFTF